LKNSTEERGDVVMYSNINTWKQFVKDYIVPLKESSETIIDYWNFLKNKIDNKPVDELMNNEVIKTVLFGGVKETGEYSERSLALFYKKFFGTHTNVKAVLEYLRVGVTPDVKGMVTTEEEVEAKKPTEEGILLFEKVDIDWEVWRHYFVSGSLSLPAISKLYYIFGLEKGGFEVIRTLLALEIMDRGKNHRSKTKTLLEKSLID